MRENLKMIRAVNGLSIQTCKIVYARLPRISFVVNSYYVALDKGIMKERFEEEKSRFWSSQETTFMQVLSVVASI